MGRHRNDDPSNDTRDAKKSSSGPLRASHRRPGVLGIMRQDVPVLWLALGMLLIGLSGNIVVLHYALTGGLSV